MDTIEPSYEQIQDTVYPEIPSELKSLPDNSLKPVYISDDVSSVSESYEMGDKKSLLKKLLFGVIVSGIMYLLYNYLETEKPELLAHGKVVFEQYWKYLVTVMLLAGGVYYMRKKN